MQELQEYEFNQIEESKAHVHTNIIEDSNYDQDNQMNLSEDEFKDPFYSPTKSNQLPKRVDAQMDEDKIDDQNDLMEDIVNNTNPDFIETIPTA